MQVSVHQIKALSVFVTDYQGNPNCPPFTTIEFVGGDEEGRVCRTVFFLKGEAVIDYARALAACSDTLKCSAETLTPTPPPKDCAEPVVS